MHCLVKLDLFAKFFMKNDYARVFFALFWRILQQYVNAILPWGLLSTEVGEHQVLNCVFLVSSSSSQVKTYDDLKYVNSSGSHMFLAGTS